MSLVKKSRINWPEFSDFFENDWFPANFKGEFFSPAINVIDNDQNYEIEVAAPGMKKEDFSIHLENRILTITGKSEKEKEEKEKNYTRKEFSSRSFTKSFTLPDNVEDEVSAKYEDGVLNIHLDKCTKETLPKKEVIIK